MWLGLPQAGRSLMLDRELSRSCGPPANLVRAEEVIEENGKRETGLAKNEPGRRQLDE